MRISDWSSDVCSSDLPRTIRLQEHGEKKEIDMSRRRRPEKREILPDPKFGDEVLSKFMNSVMLDGKKAVAEGIVYGALDTVEAKAKKDPLGVFHEALNNIKPGIEVRRSEEHTSKLQSLKRI